MQHCNVYMYLILAQNSVAQRNVLMPIKGKNTVLLQKCIYSLQSKSALASACTKSDICKPTMPVLTLYLLMMQADLEKQAGKLRKVEAHLIESKPLPNIDPLMAVLQQGIAKMAVHSIAIDNTTGCTATWQASLDK